MKNLFRTILTSLIIGSLLFACTEDYFEFDKIKTDNWNPSFGIALVNSELSLADIVARKDTTGLIVNTSNSGLEVVYKASIVSSDTSTVVNIPGQAFSEIFTLPIPIPPGPPLNTGQREEFAESIDIQIVDSSKFDVVVDSMTLKSGTLAFTLENSFPYELTITAKFRTFTDPSGDTLVLTYVIPAAAANDSVIQSKEVDLAGFQVNLSEDKDGNPADNTLPLDITYAIQLISGVASDANDRLEMTGGITNIDFIDFYGSLGNNILPLEKDSIAIEFFKNFQEFNKEDFFIADPSLKLTARNGFACPMQFEFISLNAVNPSRNPSVVSFDIPSGLKPLYISPTEKYGIEETVFEINRNNSNLDSILSHLTKTIAFDSEAQFNPNGIPPRNGQRRNFITDTSDLGLDLEFRIPFEGKANGFFVEDTLSVDLGRLKELSASEFRIITENGFPMAVDLQITFLDNNKQEITKLILPSYPKYSNGYGMLLEAAQINSSGEAIGSGIQTVDDIPISEERMRLIAESTYAVLSSKLSTTDANTGANVVFKSDNRLKIALALKTSL